jgi:hypothetical protein
MMRAIGMHEYSFVGSLSSSRRALTEATSIGAGSSVTPALSRTSISSALIACDDSRVTGRGNLDRAGASQRQREKCGAIARVRRHLECRRHRVVVRNAEWGAVRQYSRARLTASLPVASRSRSNSSSVNPQPFERTAPARISM